MQDLVRRLEALMWGDWHEDVRAAAVKALAGTGHGGRVIHDSLLDRITHQSQLIRRDALRTLGRLGGSRVCRDGYTYDSTSIRRPFDCLSKVIKVTMT